MAGQPGGQGRENNGQQKRTDGNTFVRNMASVARRKVEYDSQYVDWLVEQKEAGFEPIRTASEAFAYYTSFQFQVIDDTFLRQELAYLKRNGVHPDTDLTFLYRFQDMVLRKEAHRMLLGNIQNIGHLAAFDGDYESGTRVKPEAIGKLSTAIAKESGSAQQNLV